MPDGHVAWVRGYEAARRQAALFDRSSCGKVELVGPEAARFLHNLCTNEIVNLPVGAGCEAFLTTAQAKTVAYVMVYRTTDGGADALWLDPGPDMGSRVVQHLDRHLISEQLEIRDRTTEFAQFHLCGPAAHAALTAAAGGTPPDDELRHTLMEIAGARCPVRARWPLGLEGWDVLMPADRTHAVREALVTAGAVPALPEAYESLRLEAATPESGIDVDDSCLPQEIGRVERTISFTKGCYIGQETVARIRTYGHVNRLLVGLIAEGTTPIQRGAGVWREGKEVGKVTSSAYAPESGRVLALAYLRRGHHDSGLGVEVETKAGRRPAETASLPFGPVSETAPRPAG